jgi:hypothetical protein
MVAGISFKQVLKPGWATPMRKCWRPDKDTYSHVEFTRTVPVENAKER